MKELLVAMYPAAWRARYGEEFRSLLDERPVGPLDVVDIAVAAFQARLHRGRPGSADALPAMPRSLRIGGWAAVVGGLLWLLAMVGLSVHDQPVIPITVFVLAECTLLLALLGLSAYQARRRPAFAWAAFLVPAIGMSVSLTGIAAMLVTGDQAVVGELSGWHLWSLGIFGFAAGSLLFAISCGRDGAFRTARYLGAATLLYVGSLFGGMGLYGDFGIVVLVIGWVGYAIGWIRLGAEALRLDRGLSAPSPG
jgi:hypothetical protein